MIQDNDNSLKINGFKNRLRKFMPFWFFLTFFKFGGGLHYTMLAPIGEKLFPVWFVGIMIGISAFAQLLLDIPAGYLLDKYGYRRLLKITTFLFIISAACFLLGFSKTAFLLSLIVSTFGWLFFGPGINAYVINQSPAESVGKFISTKDVFASVGIVLASALIPLAVTFDIKILGIILLSIFTVAFILISFAPKEKEIHHQETAHPILHKGRTKKNFLVEAYRAIIRLRPASIMLLSVGLSASTFYGIIWFVVPLLIAHEAHNGVLGIGLGVFDFSVVILGSILGKIVDSFNKKALILLGLVVFSMAGIFLGFNFGLPFILLGFLATSGEELTGLSLWAWLYKIDKKHESYGLISGTISLFEDLGWTIGPILAGILYGIVGPTWTIAIGGLIVFCNLVIFLLVVKSPMSEELNLPPPLKFHRRRYKH